MNVRVYYEDTDAGGRVYYANYLKFCERARTEWLRAVKITQQEMLEQGRGFVVSSCKVKYRGMAKLDDELLVSCVPLRLRHASLTLYQQVCDRLGRCLCELECALAFVDTASGRPLPLPETIYEFVKSILPEDVSALGVKLS
ncbi:MAG: YbgC/FadM family acyl-CoA thioesterase [Succinivibrio sp.]|nr:YbgC/FadM family acyl-CoA thioesterase [Succinivibrio sp.]